MTKAAHDDTSIRAAFRDWSDILGNLKQPKTLQGEYQNIRRVKVLL
jgi:hypothetical protein